MQTDAETNVNSGTFKHHYRQINFTSKNIYCFEYLTFHSKCCNTISYYSIWRSYRIPRILYVTVRLTGISIHNDQLHHPYLCREPSENSVVSHLLT